MRKIYTSGGEYYRALQALKRAISGYFSMDVNDLPSPYWQGLFPRPYWDALRSYSEENGLDPYLVASLIRQESEFNPSAISHANAYGLMQLLPTDWEGRGQEDWPVALQHRFAAESRRLTLSWARTTSATMVDQFGGQVEYALAAYNAGADRVQDWRALGELSRYRGVRRVDPVHRDARIRAGHRA